MTGEPDRVDGRWSWVVATVGAVAMIFTFGTAFSYGIFLREFPEVFEASRLALSGVFAGMLFSFFIGSGAVGVLASRWPTRAVLLGCAVAAAVVAPSLYVVDSVVGLAVAFAMLGLSMGTAYVIVASVVPLWFDAYRGAATGLIFVGNGLGLFVLPPAWQLGIDRLGVRQGVLAIVAVTAVAFAATGLVCRRPSWAERSTPSGRELAHWLVDLARTRTFQLLFVGIGLTFAWYLLLAAFAVDLFVSRGLSPAGAATAFGAIGGVSIASRIGGGYVADRVGYRPAFLAGLGCAALGALLLFPTWAPATTVAVGFLGIGLGAVAALHIPLLMRIYRDQEATAIVGVFNVAVGTVALAAPPLGTALVEVTGSYTAVVALTSAMILGAIATTAAGTDPG